MSTSLGETVTDAEIVDRLHSGAPEALHQLFEQYGDAVHTHCFRRLGSRDAAEDATATVFLEVWRHRSRVRLHDGSALPWLLGVATNVCRNASRASRRRLRLLGRLPAPAPAPDHAPAVTDRVDAEARMGRVLAAIRELPERERDVLALVAWAGLTYEQTAAALGVSVGTVRSRLSRARRRLTPPSPGSDPEGTA